MAISSVNATRQAETGGGAGAAGSAASAAAGVVTAGVSGRIAGASAGRGFGNGTDADRTARRGFGARVPNRSPQGAWDCLCDQARCRCAAADGPA
jgi:hypothetical protein